MEKSTLILVAIASAICLCTGIYISGELTPPPEQEPDELPVEKVTVSFEVGGDVTDHYEIESGGKLIELPDDPIVDSRFVFIGWFSDLSDLSEPFDFSEPIYKDTIIYAVVAEKTSGYLPDGENFLVEFKYNISEVKTTYVIVGKDEKVPMPVLDAIVGYHTFIGWYSDDSFRFSFNPDAGVRSNMTVYGFYDTKTCAVTFNGGEGQIITGQELLEVKLGQTITDAWGGKEKIIANRPGYIFDHWETTEGDTWDIKRDVITSVNPMLLIAQWTKLDAAPDTKGLVEYIQKGNSDEDIIGIDKDTVYVHIADMNGVVFCVYDPIVRGTGEGPLEISASYSTAITDSISDTVSTAVSHTKIDTYQNAMHFEAGFNVKWIEGGGGYERAWNHGDEYTDSKEFAVTTSHEISMQYSSELTFPFQDTEKDRNYAIVLVSDVSVIEKIRVVNGEYEVSVMYSFSKPQLSGRSSPDDNFLNFGTGNISLLSDQRINEIVNTVSSAEKIHSVKLHSDSARTETVNVNKWQILSPNVIPEPTKDGQKFFGWSMRSLDDPLFDGSKIDWMPVRIDSDLDLYAVWLPNYCDSEYKIISNEEQLRGINNDRFGSYVLLNDITLTKDWIPIGLSDQGYSAFYGTIDGNGHTIHDMNINMHKKSSLWYYPTFVAINRGTISNINFDNASIDAAPKNYGASTRIDCGVIVGDNFGPLYDCKVSNSRISVHSSNIDKLWLESHSSIPVMDPNNGPQSGDWFKYASLGFTGKYCNDWEEDKKIELRVGGISGANSGDISNCRTENVSIDVALLNFNHGPQSGMENAMIHAGGVLGYSCGTLQDCYADGTLNVKMALHDSGDGARAGLGYVYDYAPEGCMYVGGVLGYSESNCFGIGSNCETYVVIDSFAPKSTSENRAAYNVDVGVPFCIYKHVGVNYGYMGS